MRLIATLIFLTLPWQPLKGSIGDPAQSFFKHLSELDFQKARHSAGLIEDQEIKTELFRLADIMFEAGQTTRPLLDTTTLDPDNTTLAVIRHLQRGYISLHHDQLKGAAYKEFYSAYQLAISESDKTLIKACLYAMLEYHSDEIAQNSDVYMPYLDQLKIIKSDTIDDVWLSVYQSIFYSKNLKGLDSVRYFDLLGPLTIAENNPGLSSPMRSHVLFEKALNYELRNSIDDAELYYTKSADESKNHNFLHRVTFSCYIKLMGLASQKRRLSEALRYRQLAKKYFDLSDTLRSTYYITRHTAFLYEEFERFDSAYFLLKKAYAQDFQLDFRRNTLEVNRLSVELETQEKQNSNLRLTQERAWLITGISVLGLLIVVGYLFNRNLLAKSKMRLQQNELESVILQQKLKEQEIIGIDQMIDAQEKERQRIANELHDNLGSQLASIKFHFQSLQQSSSSGDHAELFQKTDELLEEAYQKVRTLAHARNVGVNSKDGLMPAVKTFASKVSAVNKLQVDVEEHGMDTRLENSLEILLFRTIQELVTNVIKHAKATELTIHLTRHNDSINLMVEDNGVGFDISKIKPADTMGLYSIQKRIENLGGSVVIDSIAGKGTTIIIDAPI